MSKMTVADLATQMKITADTLLKQLNEAGVDASADTDTLTAKDKQALLKMLRERHGKSDDKKTIGLKKSGTLSPKKKTLKSPAKKTADAQDKAPAAPKKLSPLEIAKKMAEEKRLQQEKDFRESAEADRVAKEAEEKVRIETEKAQREAKQKAEAEAKKEAEVKRQAEEKLRKQQSEEDARKKAERLKNLDKEAEENAKAELEKQQQREKENQVDAEKVAAARKQAEADLAKQERVESLSRTKFRENKKEARKNTKRRERNASVENKHKFEKPTKTVVAEVALPETLTVGELAQKMNRKSGELIKELMKMGSMMNINQLLDQDTAALLCEELGHKYSFINDNEAEDALSEAQESNLEDIRQRAPIVTIMGHVDHGKTSLLDYIRSTRVVSGEAGGITQHIGSYHVKTERGGITFLDTPGHAAFTAMRARGAKLTDIVVIVVAADDGVMPQTIEAIQHAKASEAPIIIAVNKIDKPEADKEKIKSELSQHEIVSEEWGGDTMFAYVSAKTGEGIEELLEQIVLQAEVMELESAYKGPASGVVVESRVDKGRGVVANLIVSQGLLKKGTFVLAGEAFGRVRAMMNDLGEQVNEAGPSMPVEILGLSQAPDAGEEFLLVENEKTAKSIAQQRAIKAKEAFIARQQKAKLENLFANVGDNKLEEVNILIKTDVQGSAEALRDALVKLSTDEVAVKIISANVGGITETDMNLAIASEALIIGFNVRAETGAKKLAENEGVDLRYYSVIYDAIDDVRAAMEGKLAPEIQEEIVGIAEVKDVFKAPKFGQIAGCIVSDGYVKRDNPIRVLRDNVVIYEGELESLRRFKDDVNEVRAGTECGIGVKNYNDVKAGDQIECYERREVKRTIEG